MYICHLFILTKCLYEVFNISKSKNVYKYLCAEK